MNTTKNRRIVRLIGSLCCLAVLFSYRPETQAEEKTPKAERPVQATEAAPAQHELPRTRSIFGTASYLQGKSIFVPPTPENFVAQPPTPPSSGVTISFRHQSNRSQLPCRKHINRKRQCSTMTGR